MLNGKLPTVIWFVSLHIHQKLMLAKLSLVKLFFQSTTSLSQMCWLQLWLSSLTALF